MVYQTRAKRDTMRKRLVEITNSLEELKPVQGEQVDERGTTVYELSDTIREMVDLLWHGVDNLTHLSDAGDIQRSVIMRLNDIMDDLENTGNDRYNSMVTLLDLIKTDLEMRNPDGSPDFAQYTHGAAMPADDMVKAIRQGPVEEQTKEYTVREPAKEPATEPFPILTDGAGREYVAFVGGPDGDAIAMTQRRFGAVYPYLNLSHGTHVTQLDRVSVAKLLPYFVNFVATGYFDCATQDEVKEKYGD